MLAAQLPDFRAAAVEDKMLAGCFSKAVEQKLEREPAQRHVGAKAEKPKYSFEVTETSVYKPSIQLLAYAAYNQQPEVAEDKVEVAVKHRPSLNRPHALLLQNELLKAFTAPGFQRKLHELARMHNATKFKSAEYKFAFQELVRAEQISVIKKHGFRASEEGVKDMLQVFAEFENDADVYVNSESIKEALFSSSTPAPSLEPEEVTHGEKPRDSMEVMELLRDLHDLYSLPDFQAELEDLKLLEEDGRSKAGGYYHLSGRAELALAFQVDLLPLWGFEASKEGVQEMISLCAQFLHVKEVQGLFDAINSKLGMSDKACQRFRRAAALLQDTPCIAIPAVTKVNALLEPRTTRVC
jgi:hypothetical protein